MFIIFTIILPVFLHSNVLAQEYVNGDSTPFRFNRIQDVYLRYYNGTSTNQFVQFPLSQASRLFNIVGFKQNGPITFYAHGYNTNANSFNVLAIASAYLEAQSGTNIVIVDWSNMAQGDYYTNAALNARPVGKAVGAQISALIDGGLNASSVHCVGHSLGSHICGYAGREMKSSYQKTLKRITGLDPALPSYYPESLLYLHIRATDAEFVDIIHTDGGEYGTPFSTGTADFYPNGGIPIQPGCLISLPPQDPGPCSHLRSWQFYAESVRTPKVFQASPADNYLQFTNNPTPEVGMVYMGYQTSLSATGNFYLTTNSASPYGKGTAGLKAN